MQDLRLAVRALRATPIVSSVAILSLALGIGANTAIFSLVNSLLLRPLPVTEPQRLAVLSGGTPDPPAQFGPPLQGYTYAVWDALRARTAAFDGICAWSMTRLDLSQGGEMQQVEGVYTSGDFFAVLGVPALLGRTFVAADDVRGGGPDGAVAVISYGFWQRHFGGAANVIGTVLAIERVPFTIIGVTPPDFLGTEVGRAFDVAVPITSAPLLGRASLLEIPAWYLRIMFRLKPGQSIDSATATLRGVQPQIRDAAMPQRPGFQSSEFLKGPFSLASASAGTSSVRQRYRRALLTIFGVVALVLLITCANIANLLLARGAARQRELSVRLAIGAPRWRLARQLLIESLVLSAAGGGLGLLFAQWASRALVAQLSTQANPVVIDLSLDWRMLVFTGAITIAITLLFGTAPAFRATRVAPIEALRELGRGSTRDHRMSASSALVIAQVAISLVLVVAAGLFIRTFSRLASLPLGFDADRVLIVNVNTARVTVDLANRVALFLRCTEAIATIPGIASAGGSIVTPLSGGITINFIQVPGAPAMSESERIVATHFITPGWFAAYGTPIRSGRDLDARDAKTAQPTAIVNEAFARKFFPGGSPLGATVGPGRPTPGDVEKPPTIVGVVADTVYRSLREPLQPTLYRPLSQVELPALTTISISVRAASGSPALLARPIANALMNINRDLAFTFRPLSDQVNTSLTQERIVAILSGFFGALALLLAALGLYGITAYAVARRRTEIGIRMALGAEPVIVLTLVLRRVAVLVAIGIAVGAILSWWAAQFVSATLLYGVEARDSATFATSAAVLAVVGALAGWLPARRASRVDPAEVLREG